MRHKKRNPKKGEAQSFITRTRYHARSYIGYCQSKKHKGYVSIEALCRHECFAKQCPFLQRFPEHQIYHDRKYKTKRIPPEKLAQIKNYIWKTENSA